MGVKLSVCMIVRNEEDVLARCLSTASRFADEIIVVDTGSTDRTKEIATHYTPYVYDYEWRDDFSSARNYSFSFASGEYIMWLDADHIIDDENVEKIKELKNSLESWNSVCFDYRTPEDGMSLQYHMIMKRDERKWMGVVHERFPLKDDVLMTPIVIRHRGKETSSLRYLDSVIRNSRLSEGISDEEVKSCFWLGVQLFIDLTLSGDKKRAERMLEKSMSQDYDRGEMLRCFLLAGNNFMYRKHYEDALSIYSACIENIDLDELAKYREGANLLLRIQKALYYLGRTKEAFRYNDVLLRYFPSSLNGALNKAWYEKFRKVSISVCMIVRDEEAVLARVLSKVTSFADEIIVVDTGSVDATRDIALRYTDKVFDYEWHYDFAEARNYSYSKAESDYIMWLDADDDIDEDDIKRIIELKNNMPPDVDVVSFLYRSDEDKSNPYTSQVVLRDRLIRRELNLKWCYPIHESLIVDESCKFLHHCDISIVHRKVRANEKRRNISIFERKMAEGWTLDSFNLCYYCRELYSDNRRDDAVMVFEKLFETKDINSISYALFYYIDIMKKEKRYKELEEKLWRCLSLFGANEEVFCALGDIMRRGKRDEEAVKMYSRAIATVVDLSDMRVHLKAYNNFIPLIGLAKAYLDIGNIEEAKEALERAEELYPENTELKILLLYVENMERKKKR